LEQPFSAVNANLFERVGSARMDPTAAFHPPAVLLIDVSGFTQLTEERADYAAREVGELLHERQRSQASETRRAHQASGPRSNAPVSRRNQRSRCQTRGRQTGRRLAPLLTTDSPGRAG